jgi:hypothetical protein
VVHGFKFEKILSALAVAVVAATAAWAVPVPTPAANVDEKLFQELRWRLIGPFRGGRVLAVAGVPGETEREHFYFGSVNGPYTRGTYQCRCRNFATEGTRS